MREIQRRLAALEASSGGVEGWDYSQPCHEVVVEEDEPAADALRRYGLHRIGDRDNFIMHRIVSPKFDEAGNHVRRDSRRTSELQHGCWRELYGISDAEWMEAREKANG